MLPSNNRRETQLPGFSDARAVRPQFSVGQTAETLRKLVTQPKSSWLEFSAAGKSFQKLYEEYVFVLAAIPPVSGFIGNLLFRGGRHGGIVARYRHVLLVRSRNKNGTH